jgi:ABC-type multidrug transport system ATPase subunit
MSLNLIKLCVGCDSVQDLKDWIKEQRSKKKKAGEPGQRFHRTRMVPKRVEELLDLVDLQTSADRTVGGFSLGMRQRLALAAALIGDPSVLVLDEPFNGLDPDGIRLLRQMLRTFADDGGTVFLSSHLLAEVAHSADELVVIHRGHLVTAGPTNAIVGAGQDLETTFHNLVHPNDIQSPSQGAPK